MYIIRPIKITDAMLISSTVPETDYAAYVAGTTYALGTRVIVIATHKIYESAQAGNLGHYPPDNLTGTIPWWIEVSATNRHKIFDEKVGDQTSQAGSFNYVLQPGMFDSITLFNVEGLTLRLVLTDPTEGVVYDKTINLLSTANVIDGYTYCFEPFIYTTALARLDIPPYGSASLSITLTGVTAKCGEIVVGLKRYIGDSQWGISVSDVDFSKKDQDPYGNFIVVERPFSRKLNCDLWLPSAIFDETDRLLTLYRAKPVVWVGSPNDASGENIYASMLVYGFRKSFNLVAKHLQSSGCSLEIIGLT
jgi:hypothetical protein